MTFLNPLVLFGLVAAGIPLLIHLFNFRRPQKVDFSSLVFLRELRQTTMQRVRIKQWLLLILRTLAIASLVLAFARPTLKGSAPGFFGGEAESAAVLVVDNSLSMTVRDVDGILLEQAREAALGFGDLLREGDQMAVLALGVRDPASEVRWARSPDALADELGRIVPSAAAMTVAEAVSEAGRLLSATTFLNREVFVLSDLQSTALGDSLTSEFPADVPVRLVRIGQQPAPNTAVTDVRLASQIIEPGRPVRIEATVASSGSGADVSVLASVFLDGERSAGSEIEISPNSSVTAEFVVTPRRTGWLEGVVEIEDDAFPEDNRRYFALSVPESRRVLLVRGEDFRATYLGLALSAEVAPGRTRYDLETVQEGGVPVQRLSDYDAVILAGLRNLSSGAISALSAYASGGGGLLVFPPDGTDLFAMNDLMDRLGGGSVAGMPGGPDGAVVAVIESADMEHPLFEGVFQNRDDRGGPKLEELDVYRFVAYDTRNAAETTIILLSTGHPFLQEIPVGSGKVLFVASQPAPEWSELPVRGLFIPLLYRSLSYLSAADSPGGESLIIGDRVDLRVTGVTESDLIEVVGPEVQVVPSQRPSFGGMVITAGPGLTAPGIYDVRAGERLALKLSANLNPAESDLRTLDAAAASERLRGGTDVDVRGMELDGAGSQSLADAVTTMRTGVEMWNVFMGVALAFLLLEMLVSRLWRPESASP